MNEKEREREREGENVDERTGPMVLTSSSLHAMQAPTL